MCCPLGEADGQAQCWTRTTRRARKPYLCSECDEVIEKGTKYDYMSMLWEGSWSTTRTCLVCAEIGDHFSCGSRVVGALWFDLEENFFPDMKAGGPCMDGLSPAAKAMLFERRTKWLLSSGIDQNGAPPPWHEGAR